MCIRDKKFVKCDDAYFYNTTKKSTDKAELMTVIHDFATANWFWAGVGAAVGFVAAPIAVPAAVGYVLLKSIKGQNKNRSPGLLAMRSTLSGVGDYTLTKNH